MSATQHRVLFLAVAALVPPALFATRDALGWPWRVAVITLVAGAVPVLASLGARELEARPSLARWVRGSSGALALAGVVAAKASLALAALVALPAAWLLAGAIGRVRGPGAKATERWIDGLLTLGELAVKVAVVLGVAVAMAFKYFPEQAHRGLRAAGLEQPVRGVSWSDAGLKRVDAAADAPALGSHTLRQPVSLDVVAVDIVREEPPVEATQPSEVIEARWLSWDPRSEAVRAIERKIEELRTHSPDASFARSIQGDLYVFVVTYANGHEENWAYDRRRRRVVQFNGFDLGDLDP